MGSLSLGATPPPEHFPAPLGQGCQGSSQLYSHMESELGSKEVRIQYLVKNLSFSQDRCGYESWIWLLLVVCLWTVS